MRHSRPGGQRRFLSLRHIADRQGYFHRARRSRRQPPTLRSRKMLAHHINFLDRRATSDQCGIQLLKILQRHARPQRLLHQRGPAPRNQKKKKNPSVFSPPRPSRSKIAFPAAKLCAVGKGCPPTNVCQPGKGRKRGTGTTRTPSGGNSGVRASVKPRAIVFAAFPNAIATISRNSRRSTSAPPAEINEPRRSSLRASAEGISIAARVCRKTCSAVFFTALY